MPPVVEAHAQNLSGVWQRCQQLQAVQPSHRRMAFCGPRHRTRCLCPGFLTALQQARQVWWVWQCHSSAGQTGASSHGRRVPHQTPRPPPLRRGAGCSLGESDISHVVSSRANKFAQPRKPACFRLARGAMLAGASCALHALQRATYAPDLGKVHLGQMRHCLVDGCRWIFVILRFPVWYAS